MEFDWLLLHLVLSGTIFLLRYSVFWPFMNIPRVHRRVHEVSSWLHLQRIGQCRLLGVRLGFIDLVLCLGGILLHSQSALQDPGDGHQPENSDLKKKHSLLYLEIQMDAKQKRVLSSCTWTVRFWDLGHGFLSLVAPQLAMW